MRLLTFLLLSTLLFISCKKDQIHPQNVSRVETGTVDRLNNILFVNDSLAVIVGGTRFDDGVVLVSRDGGYTWALDTINNKELFGIAAAPDGAIYTIGFDGHMLRSTDQARSWTHFQLRFEAYKSLAFADAEHLYCIGGISFERGDAMWVGREGEVLAHDTTTFELNDIVLQPDGHGLRSGYGVMQYTYDGGKTWSWTTLRNDNFKALDAHGPLLAYTCGGEGSIYVTRNGGKDWETLRNGNKLATKKYRLQDLIFLDENLGYSVGEDGAVIKTTDGGVHWSEMEPFTTEHIYSIARCPNGDLLMCGANGGLWRVKP